MFDRSRYNWATTKIEATGKFDFLLSDEQLNTMKVFLADDAFFEACKDHKSKSKASWYEVITVGALKLGEQEEWDIGKNMWAAIAACAGIHVPNLRAQFAGPADAFTAACEIVGCSQTLDGA